MSAARDRHQECERAPRQIDIDEKAAFLGSTRAYAGQASCVERIETHFSWVFLTDRHVYKLKKPLRGEGFDFSSLEARRRNAEEEVRLNGRLAGDVYLGTVPLTLDAAGSLALGGRGRVIDWLVEMARLPAECILDRRLAKGDWHYAEIHSLAGLLTRFFNTARRVAIPPNMYLDRMRVECRASRRAFYACGGPALQYAAQCIARPIETFIGCRRDLLLQRLRSGRIVEGHGDLRPEHICIGPAPRVIDCLEFRADLRVLDPVQELSFLAMECDRLGARNIGQILFHQYRQCTDDCPPPVLISIYKAMGALIRARLAILHLKEPRIRGRAKWPRRAAEYLAIASRELHHSGRWSIDQCGLTDQ